jgi:hypothetical protein
MNYWAARLTNSGGGYSLTVPELKSIVRRAFLLRSTASGVLSSAKQGVEAVAASAEKAHVING